MGDSGGIEPPMRRWTAGPSHCCLGARWFSPALRTEEEPSFRSTWWISLSGWNLAPVWGQPRSRWFHCQQLLLLQIIAPDSSMSCFLCVQSGKLWGPPSPAARADCLPFHVSAETRICYSRDHQATRTRGVFQTVFWLPISKKFTFCLYLCFPFWFVCND